MLKENYVNLRETSKGSGKKCIDCGKAFRERFEERIYMSCQKLDVILRECNTGEMNREDSAFVSRNKVNINPIDNSFDYSRKKLLISLLL